MEHSPSKLQARLRHCDPPNADDIMNSVVRSPDSAPGLDGLPYAAYRKSLPDGYMTT